MSNERWLEEQAGALPADEVRRGLAEEERDVDQYGTDPALAGGADEVDERSRRGQDADRR